MVSGIVWIGAESSCRCPDVVVVDGWHLRGSRCPQVPNRKSFLLEPVSAGKQQSSSPTGEKADTHSHSIAINPACFVVYEACVVCAVFQSGFSNVGHKSSGHFLPIASDRRVSVEPEKNKKKIAKEKKIITNIYLP